MIKRRTKEHPIFKTGFFLIPPSLNFKGKQSCSYSIEVKVVIHRQSSPLTPAPLSYPLYPLLPYSPPTPSTPSSPPTTSAPTTSPLSSPQSFPPTPSTLSSNPTSFPPHPLWLPRLCPPLLLPPFPTPLWLLLRLITHRRRGSDGTAQDVLYRHGNQIGLSWWQFVPHSCRLCQIRMCLSPAVTCPASRPHSLRTYWGSRQLSVQTCLKLTSRSHSLDTHPHKGGFHNGQPR